AGHARQSFVADSAGDLQRTLSIVRARKVQEILRVTVSRPGVAVRFVADLVVSMLPPAPRPESVYVPVEPRQRDRLPCANGLRGLCASYPAWVQITCYTMGVDAGRQADFNHGARHAPASDHSYPRSQGGASMPQAAFLLLEVGVYILAISCLRHAWAHGSSRLVALVAGMIYGVLIEYGAILTFHAYVYGHFLIMIFGAVPLCIGVSWGLIIYTAMETSDRFALPWYLRPIVDALLALTIDLSMDAIAIRLGLWTWGRPVLGSACRSATSTPGSLWCSVSRCCCASVGSGAWPAP